MASRGRRGVDDEPEETGGVCGREEEPAVAAVLGFGLVDADDEPKRNRKNLPVSWAAGGCGDVAGLMTGEVGWEGRVVGMASLVGVEWTEFEAEAEPRLEEGRELLSEVGGG